MNQLAVASRITDRHHAGYQPLLHQLTAQSVGIRRRGGTSVPVGLAEELQRLAGELKLV